MKTGQQIAFYVPVLLCEICSNQCGGGRDMAYMIQGQTEGKKRKYRKYANKTKMSLAVLAAR